MSAPISFQRQLWVRFSPVLGCDLAGVGMWSCRCFKRCDLTGAGVRRDRCDLGLGPILGAMSRCFWCDLLVVSLFLSFSSIFLGYNSFQGKIEPEIILCPKCLILRSTWNTNSVWPNFQYLPNRAAGVKAFLEMLWSQNKRSLRKLKKALNPNVVRSVMDPQYINLCWSHVFFSFILFYKSYFLLLP